jgi:hypothetical protein
MVRELRALMDAEAANTKRPITLDLFLNESGLEPLDVYKNGSWSDLKRSAGLPVATPGPQEKRLGEALHRLLHIDDPLRLAAYRDWLQGRAADPRLITALVHTLWTSEKPFDLEDAATRMRAHPAIVSDALELLDVLEARADHLTIPWSGAPLSIHARHSLVEILSAFGRITPEKFYQHREGPYYDKPTGTDMFFVTLEKSERDYSPTTMYKDYAISPTQFHWESQSITTQKSPTGQRYIRQREHGGNVLLFVRQRKGQDGLTMPYTFLGPVDYVSHQRERPIQFVWRLRQPMPADFFRQAKVAAG